jgi:Protein of unknown function (DUF2867)
MESMAIRACRLPDFADMQVVALPPGATTDPAQWVNRIFTAANMPWWVKALFGVRRVLTPLLGIPQRDLTAFAVSRVEGNEALIQVADPHLDFWLGVAVDSANQRLIATTVVKLHGWRGRLYWIPAGLLHATVFKSILNRAVRSLTPSSWERSQDR